MYSRQCILRNNKTFTVSYIPEQYAKVGKILKLKENGEWKDGWIVEKVGSRRLTEEVIERSQDYKHQRKASDI